MEPWARVGCIATLIAYATSITQAANITGEGALFNDVFLNYNKQVRPLAGSGHKVHVELQLGLHQIISLDAEKQSLQNLVVITAEWRDDNLKWTPADHGEIEFMVLPASDFWLPDFGISNSAKSFYNDGSDEFRLQLKYTGEITWSFGGHVTTKCRLVVTSFPFDTQFCQFAMTNWMYDVNSVNITLEHSSMDTSEFVPNAEWNLLSTSCTTKQIVHSDRDGRTYPSVSCNIVLQRKPAYYVINMFVPSYFVLLLFLVAFWLPPGHRAVVPLQMTTLLIFSVMLLNISKHLPRTSHIPHITIFALVVVGMATVSIILTVLISVMRIYMDTNLRIPRFIRMFAFKYLATPLCLKTIANEVKQKTIPDDEAVVLTTSTSLTEVVKFIDEEKAVEAPKPAVSEEVRLLQQLLVVSEEMAKHLSSIATGSKGNRRANMIRAEWDLLSRIAARISFWLMLLVVIGLSVEFILSINSQSEFAEYSDLSK